MHFLFDASVVKTTMIITRYPDACAETITYFNLVRAGTLERFTHDHFQNDTQSCYVQRLIRTQLNYNCTLLIS